MPVLSAVRTISHGVVCLAGKHEGGGNRPSDGKIKTPPSGLALMVGRTKEFCRLVALPCRRFFRHANQFNVLGAVALNERNGEQLCIRLARVGDRGRAPPQASNVHQPE